MERSRKWKGRGLAALLAAAAVLVPATSAEALTNVKVEVTTTADVSTGAGDVGSCLTGGACSLRQAFAAAELNTTLIVLPAGTYVLEQGQLVARRALAFGPVTRLLGAGAADTTITQDVPGGSRLLHLASGQLEVAGVTFAGGSVRGADGADGGDATGSGAASDGAAGEPARGGAILVDEGYLLLYDSAVRGNEALGGDGGDGGSAADGAAGDGGDGGDADGGAIWVAPRGNMGVSSEQTVFSGNRARGGAGGAAGVAQGAAGRAGDGGDAHGGAVDVATLSAWTTATVRGNSALGGDAGEQPASGSGVTAASAGEALGGGISLRGRIVDLWDSTVAENLARGGAGTDGAAGGAAAGGGFYASGTFLVDRSTIVDNLARGGASAAAAGPARGGGIAAVALNPAKPRDSQLIMSTVARNAAQATGAGGAAAGAGGNLHPVVTVTSTASLVAQGTAAAGAGNCTAPVTTLGGNVEDDAAAACGFTAAGDTAGGAALLGPLADDGGPTPTVSLLPGSSAIDAGSCDPLVSRTRATDQRGAPRPAGGACDAGAYEHGSVAPPWGPAPYPGTWLPSPPPAGGPGPGVVDPGEQAPLPPGARKRPRTRPISGAARVRTAPLLRFRLARPATVTVRVRSLGSRGSRGATLRLGKRARGPQVVSLPRRIAGRTLAAGRYRVTVTARAAGRSRQVLRTTVTVARR